MNYGDPLVVIAGIIAAGVILLGILLFQYWRGTD